MLVLRQGTCDLFELFVGIRNGSGWNAASGARFDLTSNALRPLGWTSADAAGLPILPGLVRYDEVAAGVDPPRHPRHVQRDPATATSCRPRTSRPTRPTPTVRRWGCGCGSKASYDVSQLTGQARVIAVAMQQYGLIVADNGSNWFFQGAPSPSWDDDDLNQLKDVPGTAFEVVDTGPVHS